ncbi:pleckstrin homology domain-containing family A member 8 isoform X3 [Crotalus tigris]|uniref:pleckstrin homology domain-containing family A member 8 isoform X3 n=1 Tax=Crotalus tigris TaxID=88082 RepID=UPI00192F47DD|nr:pleckstrin homology domain-containing family A member 8 isoform X3 [Crotalus tigris]
MEGVLYKWTNYLSGWQPRWFLLAGGVLSYYDSKEDAWKGCKGSIQMAVCEIQEFTENTEMLKTKMAELRLYCDILVQQVEKIKATTTTSHVQHGINMGVLLNSSCATFLKTLEECMQIANASFSSELLQHTPGETSYSVIRKLNKLKLPAILTRGVTERKMELKKCENGSIYKNATLPEKTFIEKSSPVPLKRSETKGSPSKDGANKLLPQRNIQDNKPLEPLEESVNVSDFPTFFSAMNYRFSDIKLFEDGGIPTEEFLNSCYEIIPVLDKLGPTVFAPVKMDFEGNIKKINQKYITNKEDFCSLQKIVLHELSTEVAQIRHSATQALLWLKRGLKFLKEFLTELKNGEKNIQTALNKAYGKTLRQYHGWVVRGVFALALRASPNYQGFVAALSLAECENQEEAFYHGMQRDLNIYLPAMEKQLKILDALYEEHGLESDEVV